jgi:hypothetical protein
VDEKTGFPTFAIGNEIWAMLRGGCTVSAAADPASSP